jgi:hypothetical protein
MLGLLLLSPFLIVVLALLVALLVPRKPRAPRRPARWGWAVKFGLLALCIVASLVFGEPLLALVYGLSLLVGIVRGVRAWERAVTPRVRDEVERPGGTPCLHRDGNRPCRAFAGYAIYWTGERAPLARYCEAHLAGEYAALVQAHPDQTFEVHTLAR